MKKNMRRDGHIFDSAMPLQFTCRVPLTLPECAHMCYICAALKLHVH